MKRRLKRRNACFWPLKQRFKRRNASRFGVFDIYGTEPREAWRTEQSEQRAALSALQEKLQTAEMSAMPKTAAAELVAESVRSCMRRALSEQVPTLMAAIDLVFSNLEGFGNISSVSFRNKLMTSGNALNRVSGDFDSGLGPRRLRGLGRSRSPRSARRGSSSWTRTRSSRASRTSSTRPRRSTRSSRRRSASPGKSGEMGDEFSTDPRRV